VAYRKKVQVLCAAKDERDLLAMAFASPGEVVGKRAGTCSIRLNDQFRLILTFKTENGASWWFST